MRAEKIIDSVKEFLLWIYVVAVVAAFIYAVGMDEDAKRPGEIIYEKTHRQ